MNKDTVTVEQSAQDLAYNIVAQISFSGSVSEGCKSSDVTTLFKDALLQFHSEQSLSSQSSVDLSYDLERLYEWLMDEKRKPAITAFTSGIARNIASEIEFKLRHQSSVAAGEGEGGKVSEDELDKQILKEAREFVKSSGWVSGEAETSFIVGAKSNAAQEYWRKQLSPFIEKIRWLIPERKLLLQDMWVNKERVTAVKKAQGWAQEFGFTIPMDEMINIIKEHCLNYSSSSAPALLKKDAGELNWKVCYPDSNEIIASFKHEQWANDWRDKYSATSIIKGNPDGKIRMEDILIPGAVLKAFKLEQSEVSALLRTVENKQAEIRKLKNIDYDQLHKVVRTVEKMFHEEKKVFVTENKFQKDAGEGEKGGSGVMEHLKNIKLLQSIYGNKKFYVECFPTDKDAITFPNSNKAIKEIDLPNFSKQASAPRN